MSGCLTHLLVYLLVALSLSYALGEAPPFCLLVGAVYALLPDIDLPSSFLRRAVEAASLFSIAASLAAYLVYKEEAYVYAAILLSLALFLLWTIRHRGFFHTLAAGLILSFPLLLVDRLLFLYAFTGYLSHLLLDRRILSLI